MKFRQEFRVTERIARVWSFFEQPARVAACLPGLESCETLEDGTLMVRMTQHLGPMAASFETRVRVTESVPGERIEFTSTGKAVRGAIGNFRASNSVSLKAEEESTLVTVEGEAALAGMLGSIGQKIILKQADKMTAEFALNLEKLLSGARDAGAAPAGSAALSLAARAAPTPISRDEIRPREHPDLARAVEKALRWARWSVLLSGSSVLIGVLILWRLVRLP